jgi:hypothetical protein
MAWFRNNVDGAGVIDYASGEHTSQSVLKALLIHWSAAPTTSESIVVTIESALGSAYNTIVYSLDPSIDGTLDVLVTDINLPVYPGDEFRVAYTNTDANTVGIQVFYSDRLW